MNELPQRRRDLPVLTEVFDTVEPAPRPAPAAVSIEAVREELLSEALQLTELCVRQALIGLEAQLSERISAQLQAQLPALVERVLRTHLAAVTATDGKDAC